MECGRNKREGTRFSGKDKKWDVVGLEETWLEKKDWESFKRKIPEEFNWEIQGARKEDKKGRAAGGIWLGVRRGLGGEGEGVNEKGVIIREIKWKGEIWKIGAVYIKENLGRIMGRIKEEVEKRKGETGWIIGGDFIVRTGEKGALEDGGGRKGKKIKEQSSKQGGGIVKMDRARRIGNREWSQGGR